MRSLALICAYYSPRTVYSRQDPHGERLLLEVVRPAFQQLRSSYHLDGLMFMRFSERGYHLRLNAFGAETVLRERVVPLLTNEFERYFALHPELTQPYEELAPLSQVLNRKLGHDLESEGLIVPGVIQASYTPLPPPGPDQDHETEAAMQANLAMQDAICDALLELLSLNPSMRERMIFVRQLLDDTLRLSDLTAVECYLFTETIKAGWFDYFELTSEVLDFYRKLYNNNAARLESFLNQKRPVEDSVKLLPERLRPIYRRLAEVLAEYVPQIVLRYAGEYSQQDANRMLAVFHLFHNRLSLGIEEEFYTAHMLGQHYYHRLTAEDIAMVEQRLGGQYALRI